MADGDLINGLGQEARVEARRILRWWQTHLPDAENGGFFGEIDANDRPVAGAPKSVILNTRLLWFFSAAGWHLASPEALALADRAARYIRAHFLDPEHGGLYWLLDNGGQVIDGKKQAYAQAFGVYAFAEHYRATGNAESLDLARRLQSEIEGRFVDAAKGGYIEALAADWQVVADQRLSDKDLDAPKTMNTHLHVLEAYAHLHRVAPDGASQRALSRIIDLFADHFIDVQNRHLRLFFDMDWNDLTHAVSFGHDIEASWLLWEAVEILGDPVRLERLRPVVLDLARATLEEGFSAEGGVAYERDFAGPRDDDGEWWGQAEGMVGFVNAWQLSGDGAFLAAARRVWAHARDQFGAGGDDEWTWYAADAAKPAQAKAGQWKCPYHNGRAMIELDKRLTD